MCAICDVQNKYDSEPLHLFSDEEIEAIIYAIWAGIITVDRLDVNTYQRIARKLSDGVFSGYGKSFIDVTFGTADYAMLKALQENIYVFSGAKTYQQTREMSSLLSGRNFSQFKQAAKNVFLEYNENYLRAEYNSAIAQARSAAQWQDIVKDASVMKMLTYKMAGDGRVRPTHAELNNITRPVEDKFWNLYMPPNGWNCRCDVIQTNEKKTSLKDFKEPKDVPDIFKFNAGKDRIVFSPKHPYFKVASKDKKLARNNFGLPLP
jgi:SPP1 gp7 family putative phage head morphogenesis protein